MALKIIPEVNQLTQELIIYTGESETEALLKSLRERLAREKQKRQQPGQILLDILRIGRECAALPILDRRTPEEILGYNEDGVIMWKQVDKETEDGKKLINEINGIFKN